MLKPKTSLSILRNEKGTSALEIIPILIIFVLLLNFALGFFGVIHSGILNSIAARNYTFETFRNRSNLNYLRDFDSDQSQIDSGYYNLIGIRYHAIVREQSSQRDRFIATRRSIKFTEQEGPEEELGTSAEHNQQTRQIAEGSRVSNIFGEEKSGVNPVWLKTMYGICLNSKCAPYKEL